MIFFREIDFTKKYHYLGWKLEWESLNMNEEVWGVLSALLTETMCFPADCPNLSKWPSLRENTQCGHGQWTCLMNVLWWPKKTPEMKWKSEKWDFWHFLTFLIVHKKSMFYKVFYCSTCCLALENSSSRTNELFKYF